MDTLVSLADGFAVELTWQDLLLALIGCFLGTVMGALPGLGASNGVAILIPLAFTLGLGPVEAMILLTSVYYGAMYGGRISSILLNIPGDEPALMTTLDGYPMAQQGRGGEALAISGIASFVGAFFATWGLVFLAPLLVQVALFTGLTGLHAFVHRTVTSTPEVIVPSGPIGFTMRFVRVVISSMPIILPLYGATLLTAWSIDQARERRWRLPQARLPSHPREGLTF